MNNLEKKFYCLKELTTIVNLSYRQLKERLKVVSKRYEDRTELIFKKSNRWYIHYSLIKEFARKRKPIDYKLFITIASKNGFELEYWKFFIIQLNKSLKKLDASTRIKYVIEPTRKDIYHLHFITSFGKLKKLKSIIKQDDITNSSNDINTKIKYVYNVKGLHSYFRKQNKPILLK